jgi:hypothetical protein
MPGFWLGVCFGPFGVVAAACIPGKTPEATTLKAAVESQQKGVDPNAWADT